MLLPLRRHTTQREEVLAMMSTFVELGIGVVSSAIGTIIGTVVGIYIYDRLFKK